MNMAFMPPGGRRGMLVPGTLPASTGKGSSKIAVGWPFSTAATKLSISSGPSDEGCTANSTSYFSVIGLAGLTCTTSYCFSNSSMIGQLPPAPGFIGFMRAEELGVGGKHAHPLPLFLAHGAQRADQFVFDGNAAVDERQDHFFQPAGHRHAQEDIVERQYAVLLGGHASRLDAESFLGQTRPRRLTARCCARSRGPCLCPGLEIPASIVSRFNRVCT